MIPAIVGACGLAGALTGLALLRRSLVVVTIAGESMAPKYLPGDLVLVRRWQRPSSPGVGAVLVLREPGTSEAPGRDGNVREQKWVIKRVAASPGQPVPAAVIAAAGNATVVPPGKLVLLGDNSGQSADSRTWGLMPVDDVLGTVVRRMSRPGPR